MFFHYKSYKPCSSTKFQTMKSICAICVEIEHCCVSIFPNFMTSRHERRVVDQNSLSHVPKTPPHTPHPHTHVPSNSPVCGVFYLVRLSTVPQHHLLSSTCLLQYWALLSYQPIQVVPGTAMPAYNLLA